MKFHMEPVQFFFKVSYSSLSYFSVTLECVQHIVFTDKHITAAVSSQSTQSNQYSWIHPAVYLLLKSFLWQ